MAKANGGSVALADDYVELYPIFDTSDKKRLKRTCNDVVRETHSAREWPAFPEGAVAIGGVDYGWLILLPDSQDSETLASALCFFDRNTGEIETLGEDAF